MKDEKNVGIAILLNLFLPGAGYMYMERVVLGIFVLLLVTPIIFFTAGLAWFGWAVIMTIDMLLLKSKREKMVSARLKPCPNCAEKVQPEARVCRFCQYDFSKDSKAA